MAIQIFPAERMQTDYPWQLWAIGWLAIFKAVLWLAYEPAVADAVLRLVGWKYLLGAAPFLVCGVGLWRRERWAAWGLTVLAAVDLARDHELERLDDLRGDRDGVDALPGLGAVDGLPGDLDREGQNVAGRGLRAYASVVVAWFVFVLLFDLLVIGLTFVLPEAWATRLAITGVFANPIDATRVATLLAIAGKELFGAAGAQLVRSLGGVGPAIAVLTAVLVTWFAVPAAAGVWVLKRRDL